MHNMRKSSEQSRAEQSRAEQSRAEQSRAEQSRAERYDSLNGLRSISALLIIAMHVYANFEHTFDSVIFSTGISSFGSFVYLFLMISGFSMCCGYYDKIMYGKTTVTSFYTKRYMKILPFFAMITLLDVIVSPSIGSVCEGFANLTLAFGLLPNANIQVIGVGWTLGTIFAFYMLFPFFCYLIRSRKAAWFSLVITIIYHCLCVGYFFDGNHMIKGYWSPQNIIYCAMFFMVGGLLYLYRDTLSGFVKKHHKLMLVVCILVTAIYYARPTIENDVYNVIARNMSGLILFSVWLIYALDSKNLMLNNKIMKFLSGISLEIYLSHMFAFRVLEKFGFKHLFGKTVLSYVTIYVLTIAATIIFAVAARWALDRINFIIKKKTA